MTLKVKFNVKSKVIDEVRVRNPNFCKGHFCFRLAVSEIGDPLLLIFR